MSLAMFKLESFSRQPEQITPGEQVFSRDAVDQAYMDGYGAGQSETREAQLAELSQGITMLAASLADDEVRRAGLRAEAVALLLPLLSQILDAMAPAGVSQRLEQALAAELARLADRAAPLRARISCGPGLTAMVRDLLDRHGLDTIEIDQSQSAQVVIALEGGRIELDPEQAATEIAALISEITQESASWTH